MEILRKILWQVLSVDLDAKKEVSREHNVLKMSHHTDEKHLIETSKWLCRAQDNNTDGGVSRGYKATTYKGYGTAGWQPSYPETTGYIIPTMLALSTFFRDSSYLMRAMRMADWEIEVQLNTGAVTGSVVTAPPSPAVFNTGQVIFGWLAAFKESGNQRYLQSAFRAGDYLLSVQESDGSWRSKGNSKYALQGATTYNTRVSWALIELGLETNKDRYICAGRQNIEFALAKQHNNGWFSNNCLNNPDKPLLHTIAYATRGVLESGVCLNESRYVDAAIKTLDALLECQRFDGGLPGRLSSDWSSQANWDCLTGDVQLSIAWLRAHAIAGNTKYKDAARAAIEFVKRSQNLEHSNPGIRGGVKGSFPFDGHYGQYEMLNWAAKFFCDALLLINDHDLAQKGIKG